MKELTLNEFDFLAQFEDNYACAIEGHYLKGASLSDLQRMDAIYNRVADARRKTAYYCGACVLELLTDCGRIYRAEKEARSKAQTAELKKVSTATGTAVKSQSRGRSAQKNK